MKLKMDFDLFEQRNEVTEFSLNFSRSIKENSRFIRVGDIKTGPVRESLRCKPYGEITEYEKAMKDPEEETQKIDFVLLENGCIDQEKSSG